MVKRFHGIDRHRRTSTVSVLNREGVEEKFVSLIYDFNGYVETLGPEDVVVMETGTGAFYWADKIEARGSPRARAVQGRDPMATGTSITIPVSGRMEP